MSPSLLLKFLCGLLLVAGVVVLIGAQSGGGGDKEVLVELKRFLVTNNRVNRGGYDAWAESDPSPCGWNGVGCDGGGRVTSLNLTRSTISGPAFGSFSRLPAPTSLDLSDNSITGVLPAADLNQCRGLLHLNLSHNLITGPLDLSGLTRLRALDVSGNRLEGGVTVNVPAICADLTSLDLSTNNLTGNITGLFDACARLDNVDLSSNNFTGELWSGVARFREFSAAENNLSGRIPLEYGRLTKLQALDLSNNRLSGGIPASIRNLMSLLWLMLAGNQLSGEIPPEIGNCTSLLWLNLADNRLTGNIPPEMAEIGRNPGPTFARNRNDTSVLAGSGECQAMKRWIPASYPPFSFLYSVMTRESCRSIWDRILKGNGIVSIRANSWSPVRSNMVFGYVQLSRNMLSGEIPSRIGAMQNLSLLHLDGNRFTGRLPPEIGPLPFVELNVSRNNISGAIPSEIGEILSLERMDLSFNNLSDELPTSLFKLTQLVMFNVSYNPFLSGSISISGQFGTFDEQSSLGDPLISFSQGGSAAKQRPPPEAAHATVVERSSIPIVIIISYFFFLIVGFIAGTVRGGRKIC